MNPASSRSSPVAAPAAPRQQNQVEQQTVYLHTSIETMEKEIEQLEALLQPYLKTPAPSAGEKDSPQEYLVPAADQIRRGVDRVSMLKNRIADIAGRLG